MSTTSGGFERMLEILLPRGGGVMVMLEGYFDESGDLETDDRVFCVAGYFLASDAARKMDKEWSAVIEKAEIPFFHMVDCAHGNEAFKDKTDKERIELVKRLIALIKKYTLEGFAFVANGEEFQPSTEDPDAYSSCVSACVMALETFLKVNRIEGKIAYFFEAGHKNHHQAYNHVADKLAELGAPLTFHHKEEMTLLQAADLLAWQATKYAKDQFHKRRPPRKDFLSLMEHSHMLCYPTEKGGEKQQMAIEIWPLSKRSQHTVVLSLNQDGPITFHTEEGENIPIVMVDEAVGWRMGAAQMAYVALKDITQKDFYLAFEERRLYETIFSLIGATEFYPKSAPLIPAVDLDIQQHGEAMLIRLRLVNGAEMSFALSDDAAKRLRERLK